MSVIVFFALLLAIFTLVPVEAIPANPEVTFARTTLPWVSPVKFPIQSLGERNRFSFQDWLPPPR